MVPSDAIENDGALMKSHFVFWKTLNDHVMVNGPLPPVKVFRQVMQAFYSRTKCGVDGSAQYRSVLRSATSHLRWESKMVTQTLKKLTMNAFISWRMWKFHSHCGVEFSTLHNYRDRLNHLDSFADFISERTSELFLYAENLEQKNNAAEGQGDTGEGDPTRTRSGLMVREEA